MEKNKIKLDFSTKTKSAATLDILKVCVRELRRGRFTEIGQNLLCEAVEDYIRIKESIPGRPRKWKSMKEKNAFHNAKRRAKKENNNG